MLTKRYRIANLGWNTIIINDNDEELSSLSIVRDKKHTISHDVYSSSYIDLSG